MNGHGRNEVSGLFRTSVFFLMLFSFFFGYLSYPIKFALLFSGLLMLGLSCLGKQTSVIVFRWQDGVFFLYLAYGVLSLLYSDSLERALVYLGIWSAGIALKLVLPLFANNRAYIVNSLFAFSALHVLATLLQIIFPAFMSSLNALILDSNAYYLNNRLLRVQAYAGITGQTGTNSFYLSVFIGIAVSNLVTLPKQQRVRRFLLVCAVGAGVLALISTQKRGPVLFCFFSVVSVLYIWYSKTQRKVFRFAFLLCLLAGTILTFLSYTEYGQILMNRYFFGSYGDVLSGRGSMYMSMWEGFLEKPIFGHGLASTVVLVGDLGHTTGHNVYLQSLYDTGLIGAICLIAFMFVSLRRTVRMILSADSPGSSTSVYYLQISVYLQVFVLLYGLTGNPIYDHFQFLVYIIACAIPEMLPKGHSTPINDDQIGMEDTYGE